MQKQKEKAIQEQIILLDEIHQKVLGKEGRLKRYRPRLKWYRQKRTFVNNKMKFYQQVGRWWHENILTTGCKRNGTILDWNIATKNHNEKAKCINNMSKKLEGLQEGLKVEIHINLLKKTLKVSNWKTPRHDGIYGFWFVKFTSIHERLALEMNRCLQGTHVPEWMTILIQKDPSKWIFPNKYRPVSMMGKILTALTSVRFTTC